MSADMTKDVFAEYPYGKAALAKMGDVPENFRLYEAGGVGDNPSHDIMRVTGAEFRVAKAGPHKGKLAVILRETDRTVYVTRSDIEAHT